LLSVLKPLATSLTLGAGGSGGVFAPSLFTGAMLGDAFGRVVHGVFPAWTGPAAAYGLVAMAAVFAAAAEAPITAIVIVFEMSGDYTIVLPLMIATVIATILGRKLIGSTVYELKLQRRGIDWQRVRRPRALARTLVSSVERVPPVVARANERASDVIDRLHGTEEDFVPVVDENGDLQGIVSASDLAWHATHAPFEIIETFVRAAPATLDSSETLERAADLMTDPAIPLLAIVKTGSMQLHAIVTRRDVLDAYRSLTAS
jgi:CIC family chloride channel protein